MMMKFYSSIALALCLATGPASNAQRISDVNTIGWYNTFGTIHVNPKTSIWLEYQWRRENFITDWQQSLARIGIQRHFKNGLAALVGYGYIITYPYGDYPAGPYHIPEHRIWQQLTWNDNIGRVGLNHRMRLEQRWVGQIAQTAATREVGGYLYMNRVRYQIRSTFPLNRKTVVDKTWYLAAFDEIFVGFGRNVNWNIFDQNRIGALLGYQLNKSFRVEGGYFNQTVQQGSLVASRIAIQYNHGLILNLYYTKK